MPYGEQADAIRAHVLKHYVEPARRRGDEFVTVKAGDVHREMGLDKRVPNVCSALQAGKKFHSPNALELIKRDGPKQSPTTTFTFRLLDRPEAGGDRPARNAIRSLLGAGAESFAALGGGENWLRRERASFHDAGAAAAPGKGRTA